MVSRYDFTVTIVYGTTFTTIIGYGIAILIVTTLLGTLAVFKHKSNIQRLLAGTENRIQFKKEKTAT